MKKNILFYKLNLDFNPQLNIFTTDADLKSRVKAFAKSCNKNEMSYTNESQNYIVDIIKINEDYLFGSYGNLITTAKVILFALEINKTLALTNIKII